MNLLLIFILSTIGTFFFLYIISFIEEKMHRNNYKITDIFFLKSLKNLYYAISEGIYNVFYYLPIIWKDKDFDQRYLYIILHHKLFKMEKFFLSKNTWGADSKKRAKEIRTCRNLCKRLINEDYLNNALYWHHKKFKEISFEEMFVDEAVSNHIKLKKYHRDLNEERSQSFVKCSNHSHYMKKQDEKTLFKLMNKHIVGWWD